MKQFKTMLLVALASSLFLVNANSVGAIVVTTTDGYIDLSQVEVGDVIAVGALENGECVINGVLATLPLTDAGTFRSIRTVTDATTCEERVDYVCVALSDCPEDDPLRDESLDDMTTTTASNDLLDGPLPIVAISSCPKAREVFGRHWTRGYGGSWDVLTEVRVAMTFSYSCSDGTADQTARDGKCRAASWNGWQTNYCYWRNPATTSGETAIGVKGEFECHNWNFCRSNYYLHTLQVNAHGKNNGQTGCTYDFTGTQPPYRYTTCSFSAI